MTAKICEIGVAVDFGMTGSAVAWNEADNPQEINTIQEWPGGDGMKVPTKISIDQFGEVGSWGFECQIDSIHTKELFKIFLDSTVFNSSKETNALGTRPENSTVVANWSYFYLRSLIGYAITSIGNTLREKVENNAIEIQLLIHCILSTPTTWDANIITAFGFIAERAICDARQNQTFASTLKSIRVNITEPDAVANFIIHHKLAPLSHGDYFLVLDVGGATSDPCFCQVAEVYGHHICLVLNCEAPIRGISYGCIDIDRTFHFQVMERLSITKIPNSSSVATQMRRSWEFHQSKISYGGSQETRTAQIFNGRMIFADFKALLDHGLGDQLRRHMSEILQSAPGPLKFLAIAGGGSFIRYIRRNAKHFAPLLQVPRLEAVAVGCLIKWNKQLLLMTVIARDTPDRKFAIGTSERAAGEDVITHTWRKNVTGEQTTVCYMIGQNLFPNQGWQNWEITIETANLALPPARRFQNPVDRPAITIRVDLRLPRISPYVCSEDFTAYSAEGIQVPCHATLKLVPCPG